MQRSVRRFFSQKKYSKMTAYMVIENFTGQKVSLSQSGGYFSLLA